MNKCIQVPKYKVFRQSQNNYKYLIGLHIVNKCGHHRPQGLVPARRGVKWGPAVLGSRGQLILHLVPAQIVLDRADDGPKHVGAAAPGRVHEGPPLAQVCRLQLVDLVIK